MSTGSESPNFNLSKANDSYNENSSSQFLQSFSKSNYQSSQRGLPHPLPEVYARSLRIMSQFDFEEAKMGYIDHDSNDSVDSNFNEFALENDNLHTSGRDYYVLDNLLSKAEKEFQDEDKMEDYEEDNSEDIIDDQSNERSNQPNEMEGTYIPETMIGEKRDLSQDDQFDGRFEREEQKTMYPLEQEQSADSFSFHQKYPQENFRSGVEEESKEGTDFDTESQSISQYKNGNIYGSMAYENGYNQYPESSEFESKTYQEDDFNSSSKPETETQNDPDYEANLLTFMSMKQQDLGDIASLLKGVNKDASQLFEPANARVSGPLYSASKGSKIPTPPQLNHELLLYVREKVDEERETQKKIPAPPPISIDEFRNAVAKYKDESKNIPPPAPVMNHGELRNSKDMLDKINHENKEKTKLHLQLVQEQDRMKREEEVNKVLEENDKIQEQDMQTPSDEQQSDSPQIKSPIQQIPTFNEDNFDNFSPEPEPQSIFNEPKEDEIMVQEQTRPDQAHTLPQAHPLESKPQDLPISQGFEPQDNSKSFAQTREGFQPSMPTQNSHRMIDDPQIDSNRVNLDQKISPKFEQPPIDTHDLNSRDQSFEDFKMNKMLVSNIENLQAELNKCHDKILSLQEYNEKLESSRKDLYQEKEELIKRTIEFEYLQKCMEERDRRISEMEQEISQRSTEIYNLRTDKERSRQQMESMTNFIK